MPAHTAVAGFADTTYAISASLPTTYTASGYGASSIAYTAIGKVESFPEFGSEQSINAFPGIGGIEYTKGARSYGQGPMVVGDIPADAGQVILKAASESHNHYSMKITYPDGEIHYLDVLVGSWKLGAQSESGQMKRTAQLALCKPPVVVAAS